MLKWQWPSNSFNYCRNITSDKGVPFLAGLIIASEVRVVFFGVNRVVLFDKPDWNRVAMLSSLRRCFLSLKMLAEEPYDFPLPSVASGTSCSDWLIKITNYYFTVITTCGTLNVRRMHKISISEQSGQIRLWVASDHNITSLCHNINLA